MVIIVKKIWCRNRNAADRNSLPAQDSQVVDDCIEVLPAPPSPAPETPSPATSTTTTTPTTTPPTSPSRSPQKKMKALNIQKSHSGPILGLTPTRILRTRYPRKSICIDV